jgi:DNA-binding CsgD family transcriptional regulator
MNAGKRVSTKQAAPTPEDLIRLLVDYVPARKTEGLPDPLAQSEEILFDVDLNGARYLLMRLPKADHRRIQLSPREHEIGRMVAQGHSNKIIADVLSISSWTVCTHLRRIFAKLGVGTRAAMVARLLEDGRGSELLIAHPPLTGVRASPTSSSRPVKQRVR